MEKVDFRELKGKVGVYDVAYQLGYRLDPRGGRGRWIEMVLQDGHGNRQDKIIIHNPQDRASQKWFRHGNTEKRDVIDFIREKRGELGGHSGDEWRDVTSILCRMAGSSLPDTRDMEMILERNSLPREFDASRFEIRPASEDRYTVSSILRPRGFSQETIDFFSPFLYTVIDRQARGSHVNVGFPYRAPGKDCIEGFELRGTGGFKSKATGTNSTTAAWTANLSGNDNPMAIEHVYFAESALDIMAYYQKNRIKINPETTVLASIGGSFSDLQVKGIMSHFSDARAVACFDNDVYGRIYDVRMAGLLSGKRLNIVKTDEDVRISGYGENVILPHDKVTVSSLRNVFHLKTNMLIDKAPGDYKDWNDVIMNKPARPQEDRTKFQREDSLRVQRTNKLTL